MGLADIAVIILGLGLVAAELWYFLFPAAGHHGSSRSSVQEIPVLVKDGYDPATITVEAGRPVRLLFYRDETAECSERVVFDSLRIDRSLPPYATTAVEFTPSQPGDYPFRCGRSILRGRVVAQVGREAARVNLRRGHAKHG